jgi:hypothetical protein
MNRAMDANRSAIALSIRQPWAALVVAGLKSIEVRAWPTRRKGRILIHAARVSDRRPIGWELLPDALVKPARLRGGIIGCAELLDCIAYRSTESFAADENLHMNDPAWFPGSIVYGFKFGAATPLPFRPYPGWLRFFKVGGWRDSNPAALFPGFNEQEQVEYGINDGSDSERPQSLGS